MQAELRGLKSAAKRAREATEERDRLIRVARCYGFPLRTIAEAAGLSHTAVANICKR